MAYVPDRGDVIWLDFDPTKGTEIQKTRPALVLSPKAFNAKVRLSLVAPITSTIRGHGFEVILSGKKVSGAVLCQQIRTVDFAGRAASFVEKAPEEVIAEALKKARVLVS
nr:type II toxin-antitoxin system PemK/MazF family toxin [Endozoicomonas sp.]